MIKWALFLIFSSFMFFGGLEADSPGVGEKLTEYEAFRVKSSNATTNIVGQGVDYCHWYDPEKWSLLEKSINPAAEYSFESVDGNAFSMIIPETDITVLDEAPQIILEGAKHNGVENRQIEKLEKRYVNGVEVLHFVWSGDVMGTSFVYMYNIYSGEKGTVQVVAYTLADLSDEKKKEMEQFINGFCVIPVLD